MQSSGLSKDTKVALSIAGGLLGVIGLVELFIWASRQPEAPVASNTASAERVEPSARAPKGGEEVPKVSETSRFDWRPGKIAKAKSLRPLKTIAPIAMPPSPVMSIIPSCAEGRKPERPYTGERIEPDVGASGRSTLEITNGLSVDAAVRLVDTSTNRTSRFVYVRAHDMYKIEGIEASTYWLRYASGLDWIADCVDFLRGESIDEFEQPFPFHQDTVQEGNYLKGTWTEASASLNPVPEGTAKTRKIDRRRFLEGDQHFSLQP
jgi:hypothetical protein